MPTKTKYRLPNSLRMGLLVAGLVGLLMGALAWLQVERERTADLEEMDRRAYVLSHQMVYSVQAALQLPDREAAAALSSSLEGYPPLIGLAVYRPDGRLLAAGKAVQEFAADLDKVVARALKEQKDIIESIRADQGRIYILASAIRAPDGQPQGVLAVAQDMSQVDKLVVSRRVRFGFWVGFVTLLLLALVVAGAWLLYDRPLKRMMEWMRQLRGDDAEPPPLEPPAARLASENDRLTNSLRTARSAQRASARAVAPTGQVWTRERLRTHMIDRLRDRRLLVLSNREPYLHELQDGKTRLRTPVGGLVTALDPVLRTSGGVWIAHGAGNADRMTADDQGRLAVPPDDPAYTLRRVWLSREEEHGYYHGFANEGLWPLCHLAHERPVFRASNWEHYLRANQRFAAAALEEAGTDPAVVLVQDYHLALVPRLLKDARPGSGDRPVLAHPLAQPGSIPHLPVADRAAARPARRGSDRFPPPAALQQFPRYRRSDDRSPAGLGPVYRGVARSRFAGPTVSHRCPTLERASDAQRHSFGPSDRRTARPLLAG